MRFILTERTLTPMRSKINHCMCSLCDRVTSGQENNKTKEAAVKTHIPAHFYLYDYKSLFVRASVTIAIGIIVYSTLFGITW